MPLFVLPYPAIDPVLIHLGPFAVRWYALAYIAGLLLGWRYALHLVGAARLWGPAGAPASREQIDDLIVWMALGVVLGGRTGYVLFYDLPYYLAHPVAIVQIWHGGMSFHGGLIGVVVVIWLFCRRHGLPVLSLGDIVVCAAPIGLFFGRIANFINGELFGRISNVPWAMVFPDGGPLPRHPSQLYEASLEGIVLFCVLAVLAHRTGALKRPGTLAGAFLIGYGLCRCTVELFRQPDPQIGFLIDGLTMGIVLSLPMIAAGVILILHARRVPDRAGP
jgi:phosphatidylglycerol:prolipoprotein diacylglycerol transferase